MPAKDTSRQPPETVIRVPLPDAVDLRDHGGGVTVHDGRGRIPLDTASGRVVANLTVRELRRARTPEVGRATRS
jgi:hypothetical protein